MEFGSKFLIGQRVIVGDEIGTIQKGPTVIDGSQVRQKTVSSGRGYVWVHLPSKGYASEYSQDNVKPLPNGQL